MGGAAFDLSFDERWIDGAADVVRGGDLQHAHRAQFGVDCNLRQVGAESINGIGIALAIFVERAGGRIESGLAGEHVAVLIQRQVAQADGALLAIFFNRDSAVLEIDDRAFAGVRQAQNGAAQFLAPPCMPLCR